MLKKTILAALVVALAAPALAAAAPKQGIVVKVSAAKKLVAVANTRGAVSLVHVRSAKGLRAGQFVQLDARKLKNGTYAASSVRIVRKAKGVHVRGMVLKRTGRSFIISARGAVLTVRIGKRMRALSGISDGPPPGTVVDVSADISGDGALDATGIKTLDPSAHAGSIEGHVTAVGAGSITVADSGVSLVLAVPATFDLSKFKVGDEVLAYFSRDASGALTLSAIGGDDNEVEADDESEIEGDVAAAEQEVETEDEGGDGGATGAGD